MISQGRRHREHILFIQSTDLVLIEHDEVLTEGLYVIVIEYFQHLLGGGGGV